MPENESKISAEAEKEPYIPHFLNTPVSCKLTGLTPGRFMIFLLIAIAVHGTLFLLFRPLISLQEREGSSSRFNILLPLGQEKESAEEYGLDYWIKYTGAGNLTESGRNSNFSAWDTLQAKENQQKLNMLSVFTEGKQEESAEKKAGEKHSVRSLAEISSENPGLYSCPEKNSKSLLRAVPAENAGEKLTYPRWNLNDGKEHGGWLQKNAEAEKILASQIREKISYTQFSAVYPEDMLPPELTLIHTCGSSALDQIAERQIAFCLGSRKSMKRSAGKAFLCTAVWFSPSGKSPAVLSAETKSEQTPAQIKDKVKK